jgi:hypothetical protein
LVFAVVVWHIYYAFAPSGRLLDSVVIPKAMPLG